MSSIKYFEDEKGVSLCLDDRKNTVWKKRLVPTKETILKIVKSITSVKTSPASVNVGETIDPEDVELNIKYLDGNSDVINPTLVTCDTSTAGTAVATATYIPSVGTFKTLSKTFNVTVVAQNSTEEE